MHIDNHLSSLQIGILLKVKEVGSAPHKIPFAKFYIYNTILYLMPNQIAMEDIEIKVTRSAFPLTTFFLVLGSKNYSLRPGEVKIIKLPKEDKYEVTASSYWISNKVEMQLSDNSVVKIKHVIPDLFYLIGIPLIVFLSSLTFFEIIDYFSLSIVLLIYFTPLMYYTFIGKNKYFKMILENKKTNI